MIFTSYFSPYCIQFIHNLVFLAFYSLGFLVPPSQIYLLINETWPPFAFYSTGKVRGWAHFEKCLKKKKKKNFRIIQKYEYFFLVFFVKFFLYDLARKQIIYFFKRQFLKWAPPRTLQY